jgi:2-polyprenyl-3-methyl-5-hydroxy-6-metoxy-1,4-benzoquinol methylase
MFEAEAIRLREILIGLPSVSPLLHLGSSTRRFREVDKPHIQRLLFGPLEAAGVEIVHCDLKEADGVDVTGDIFDPEVRAALKARGFRCIIAANLLEHVRDRAGLAAACEEIVGPGGYILATVPSSFPYHADPIDTGYRPSPAQLGALFGASRPLIAEEVAGRTYGEDLKARGSAVWKELVRTLLLGLIFFARPKGFRSALDRWRWYNRRYRVSVVLLSVSPSRG